MELSEIRELKAELEDEILDLLVKFNKRTGVCVTKIEIQDYYLLDGVTQTIDGLIVSCEV